MCVLEANMGKLTQKVWPAALVGVLLVSVAGAAREAVAQSYPANPEAVVRQQRGPDWRRRPVAPEIRLREAELPVGSVTTVFVQFGLRDTGPRDWSGSVTTEGARLVRVRGWRFAPGMSVSGASWTCGSWWGPRPVQRVFDVHLPGRLWPFLRPGLLIDLEHVSTAARLRFKTAQGDFDIPLRDILRMGQLRRLRGAVRATLAVYGQPAGVEPLPDHPEEHTWHDWPSVLADNGGAWIAYQSYRRGRGDVLVVRRFEANSLTPVQIIQPPANDVYRTALGRDRTGRIWLVASVQVEGNWDLYGWVRTKGGWQGPERLTHAPYSDIHHALVRDADGLLWLVWQGFRDGQSDILARVFDGERWSETARISESPRNDWEPSACPYPGGGIAIVWDSYDQGNYDVFARLARAESASHVQVSRVYQVTSGSWRDCRASVAADRKGRLWIAFDRGGKHWGKDTGYWLELKRMPQGSRLYEHRWIELRVLDPKTGAIDLPPSYRHPDNFDPSLIESAERPQLIVDDQGRLWLLYRRYSTSDRSRRGVGWRFYWEAYITGYNATEGRWGPELLLADSTGRLDAVPGLSLHEGTLWIAWPTDHRTILGARPDAMSVFAGMLDVSLAPLSGELAAVTGKPAPFDAPEPDPVHPHEALDLARIRSYRVQTAEGELRILRGDMHRHTENSQDGGNEGSLIDVYRYALDAASLDYLLVTDHNDGYAHYQWWIREKSNDLFHMPPYFVTLYGYERSVGYPNGHRNVFLLNRGVEPLPIRPDEQPRRGRVRAGSGKFLYPYLRENQGICFSHTSATGMGTDWRDNDPELEPLVEIFQGDRTNYEMIGAPWAADPDDPSTQEGGFRPAGFVVNALRKGYRLGFQASSDHLSTHLSYACVLAPRNRRRALFEAMKKRHTYAATDNIIVDVRLAAGDRVAIMGDVTSCTSYPKLNIYVRGTRPIENLVVVRSGEVVFSCAPRDTIVHLTFEDTRPEPEGPLYYYVRVQQTDERIAWSSPIWVKLQMK